jgi:acetyltransferase-like isoleucine patch superfamily enzyme
VPERATISSAALGAGWLRATALLRAQRVHYDSWPSFTGRSPRISNRGTMVVGSRFAVRCGQFRSAFRVERDALLEIGDDVFVNQGTTVHASHYVRIGSHVRIGDVCAIYDTSFHEVDPGEGVEVAPVAIADHVWLARGVVVLPGASIGEGAVVGANSVVAGEIPPWVVAAGQPARALREIRTRGRRR